MLTLNLKKKCAKRSSRADHRASTPCSSSSVDNSMSRSSNTCSNRTEDGYIVQFMRHVFRLLSSCVELLQQILDEMKTSNNAPTEKLSQLEKVVTYAS